MQPDFRSFNGPEPSQELLHSAFFIEQICLVVAIQIVLINLLSRIFPPIENLLPSGLLHMRISSASAALCATAALFLTETNRSQRVRRIGQILGAGTILIAISALWIGASHLFSRAGNLPDGNQLAPGQGSLLAAPAAFLLLGTVILLIRSQTPLWSRIADGVASGLATLVLVLFAEFLFGLVQIPGSSISGPLKIPTLACLVLLTLTVILRRAEHGIFSVFLEGGIDGKIARIVAPILLAMPFLREIGRARLLDAHLVPARYGTAVLTTMVIVVSFALLLMLSRLIHRMQNEIQQSNLRDELTGLYNFRGFNLFAEQAYRLAKRSTQPFGVLFIDMDNLKVINDGMGHSAGSACLVETGKLLTMTFRETDVIGRLGGDEFVVAGQFDNEEITAAINRLRSGTAATKNIAGKNISLSLSMGYASTEHAGADTLKSIIAKADKAMYKEKRAKKRQLDVSVAT